MKKIIEGKIYDTQTGTKIISYSDEYEYFTLYKTMRGNYFLAHGFKNKKNSASIETKKESEAKQIAWTYCDAETYLKFFKAEEA